VAPIRPARRLAEVFLSSRLVAAAAYPIASAVDLLAARVPQSPIPLRPPASVEARPLEPRDLLRFWHECQAAVIPDHTEASLSWVFKRVRGMRSLHGELDAVSLWSKDGSLAGVYAYHLTPGDVSPMVLFGSKPALENDVLWHLLWRAREAGASAIGGRVPPRHIHAFCRAQCLLSRRPRWMLVHSRDAALLNAVLAGDDALATVDCEWFTHFNYRDPCG
jgi:hypothetical protein